jgi:biotin synthase
MNLEELQRVYHLPLMDLLFKAQQVHRENNDPNDIQRCALLSIKTGACPEDCGYCAQSGRHGSGKGGAELKPEPLLALDNVLARARAAKAEGAQRFCMGAAWRNVRDGEQFDRVIEMVKGVRALGMEACVTLGMLTDAQAVRLKEAGLTAYNHNLDTSRRHYANVVTTRTYDDRIETIKAVQRAGISACCGSILGMRENEDDRLMMLGELLAFDVPPESIPINCLVPIAGTPMSDAPPAKPLEIVRLVATTRVFFPKARIRLSAGREQMSDELQTLCFMAGANSIFFGDRLLTTPNQEASRDARLFAALGVRESANA